MFRSYLKITLRNLYKEKSYALINILGLSLGFACCIVLGLFIRSEFMYDKHHSKHERIFRIANEITYSTGNAQLSAITSEFLGPILAEEYPVIEAYVRFQYAPRQLFRHGDDMFYCEHVYHADENVFDVFTHEYIYGDPETALSDPSSIAVSESFAKKFFGDVNPIGKTLSTDTAQYKITLVFADLPENTHLKYDVLFSINSGPNRGNELMKNAPIAWALQSTNSYTYLLMPKGYQAESFQDIYKSFYTRHLEKVRSFSIKFWLEPLAEIHLSSKLLNDRPTGNKLQVYGFIAVAIFVLLVACINYINLAMARFIKRGNEVRIRKVFGSTRGQLISLFLGESIIFALIAYVLSVALVETADVLTPINDLLGKQHIADFVNEPSLLLWLLGLSFVTGIISGLYPAFYLSSASPKFALTETHNAGKQSFRLRQMLVLIQFTVSIGIIASTILIGTQIRYIINKPLGFTKKNRVVVKLTGEDFVENKSRLKNKLLQDSHILSVTMAQAIPGEPIRTIRTSDRNDKGGFDTFSAKLMRVGIDFLRVMDIPLISGRDFSRELLTDEEESVIVNEAMVKIKGWTEPLGQEGIEGKVIGVVRDFNYDSLYRQVEPLEISIQQPESDSLRRLIINISEKDRTETLKYIEGVINEFDTKHPFSYEFLDDIISKFYISETRLLGMIGIFSFICIFIAYLGLYGLTSFTTAQRTKEIGIRKVLGGTTSEIIIMLCRSVISIILAASLIASLATYWAIDIWLTDFAYKTNINPLVFLLSAASVMIVAIGTVTLQSYKTAQSDPSQSLRYE